MTLPERVFAIVDEAAKREGSRGRGIWRGRRWGMGGKDNVACYVSSIRG